MIDFIREYVIWNIVSYTVTTILFFMLRDVLRTTRMVNEWEDEEQESLKNGGKQVCTTLTK